MTETAEQQRTRVLTSGDAGWNYDLAVALGYQPERLDGIYKLRRDEPFTVVNGKIIAHEVEAGEVHYDIPIDWSCLDGTHLLSPRQMTELGIYPTQR